MASGMVSGYFYRNYIPKMIFLNPHLFLQQDQFTKNLRLAIEKIKENDFLSIKWLIGELTVKPVENGYVNFDGNEYSLFIKPVLEELFTRQIDWQCSNVSFPKRDGLL